MALFSKKTKKTDTTAVVAAGTTQKSSSASSYAHVLRHARITEKATMNELSSVYVFDISPRATKRDVIRAVQSIYNVTPRMIRVSSIPTKSTRNQRTGVTGTKRGGKKAYVYLKRGETISIS
jgi:ribosomal protein L23